MEGGRRVQQNSRRADNSVGALPKIYAALAVQAAAEGQGGLSIAGPEMLEKAKIHRTALSATSTTRAADNRTACEVAAELSQAAFFGKA